MLLLSSETGLLQGYPIYRGTKFVRRYVAHFTIHTSNLSRNSCQCCLHVKQKADLLSATCCVKLDHQKLLRDIRSRAGPLSITCSNNVALKVARMRCPYY